MFSPFVLIVAGSSTMILASPVPAAQFGGSISYDLPSDSAGPNFDVPFPNNFFTPPQPENILLAAADYTTPQPNNLLLTDYTTPQSNSLLLANTEDPKAVEICGSQRCGVLGNPIPTSPDLSPPLTPDLQWLNDKTSQPMTREFVNFNCGGTQSVCCENWHRAPQKNNLWLSCSNKQLVVSAGSSGTVPDLNIVCIQPKYYHDCDTLRQSSETNTPSPDGLSRKCYSDCPAASAQIQFPVQWG